MNRFERMALDSNSILNRIARLILWAIVIIGLGLVVAKFIQGTLV